MNQESVQSYQKKEITDPLLELNSFLVDVFHDILRLEEASLVQGELKNLSINEMHVIDAVYDGLQDESNTMAAIASRLMVTASTLTTSVKTLEQKGYLNRTKLTTDKRRVMVTPTPLSEKAYECHRNFHYKLVKTVSNNLSKEELSSLMNALSTLHGFFKTIK